MNFQLLPIALVLILPTITIAQTVNEKAESGVAHARIIAARKLVPVTVHQCLTDLSSWKSRQVEDEKLTVKQTGWWYQRLSTEELVRLASESVSCNPILQHDHRYDAQRMLNYSLLFTSEVLYRAEAVIAENYLMNEYLLRPTE